MLALAIPYLLSLMAKRSFAYSYNAFPRALGCSTKFSLYKHKLPTANGSQSRVICSLAATATSKETDQIESKSIIWHARRDCWRPDVRDVEKISFGMPAKKKRTGSRGVPHRLNEEERRSFDQARRQGFLQVTGSSWRSQRRDAPLLNSYRSLMDARGRPMIALHKMSPNTSGGVDNGDRLVVDLSPLRLPGDFERVSCELREKILAEFDVESQMLESPEENNSQADVDRTASDIDTNDNDWETRPIYQLSPHYVSWEVSRQQGKQIGKFLGLQFDIVEEKATKSKKPRGVKPGKGRRHGGYGIG
eukprot:CAMPEP_0172554600 /NCGR_PEP_ID=MMETSP1067-20121228/55410_1 /TAXON_ID=265564 ORGANISM="Thalassiosira punctigera, Strain Tpunct2005C2" /NCGR_SAMPLE_ID=MMETSP1067 /ASSEMBLY_ACC=CAM_ASM_000444 /LENGTH=304 /DNA_ID=CAMNT_0013343001 /DNA_START=61 /DNA_END=975 /DNA_ORIENTATION=+